MNDIEIIDKVNYKDYAYLEDVLEYTLEKYLRGKNGTKQNYEFDQLRRLQTFLCSRIGAKIESDKLSCKRST